MLKSNVYLKKYVNQTNFCSKLMSFEKLSLCNYLSKYNGQPFIDVNRLLDCFRKRDVQS